MMNSLDVLQTFVEADPLDFWHVSDLKEMEAWTTLPETNIAPKNDGFQ